MIIEICGPQRSFSGGGVHDRRALLFGVHDGVYYFSISPCTIITVSLRVHTSAARRLAVTCARVRSYLLCYSHPCRSCNVVAPLATHFVGPGSTRIRFAHCFALYARRHVFLAEICWVDFPYQNIGKRAIFVCRNSGLFESKTRGPPYRFWPFFSLSVCVF